MERPRSDEIVCRGCGDFVALRESGEVWECPSCGKEYTRKDFCACGDFGDYPETCQECDAPICWACGEGYGEFCRDCIAKP